MVAAPLAVVEGETEPQAGAQAAPFCVGVQVTPFEAGSLVTIAVKLWVTFSGMSALTGATDVVTAPTVTSAMLDAPVLNTDVAVMATFKSLAGGVAGAV